MNHLGSASIAAFKQFLRLAHARGIATEALLAHAGIDERLLADDTGRIAGTAFQRFLIDLAEQTQDPLLGLHCGDFVQPGSYSVLGYITMSCATLGEAVMRISTFEKLVGDMGVTRLTSEADGVMCLTWLCGYPDPRVRPHLTDNVFASWINYARWLADKTDAAPLSISLERECPDAALVQAYSDRWRCPVHFSAPQNQIRFARSLLTTPLRQPDPLLRQTLEQHAQTQMASLQDDSSSFVTRLRSLLHQHLNQGLTRQDLVAAQLGMTCRTLQRKLSQHRLSYQLLLDEARRSMAEALLRQTHLSIQDIALRLGFAESRSFQRSFKSWTQSTPGEFRQTACCHEKSSHNDPIHNDSIHNDPC